MEIENCKRVYDDNETVGRQRTIQKDPQRDCDNLKIYWENQNPLNNVLVLDVIFDHLPKKEWKSARLVNTIWHSTLQPRWRDGMIYKLGTEVIDDVQFGDVPAQFLEQQHPANNPNDLMQLGRYPIRNISAQYHVDRFETFLILQPDQTGFWELYGHRLKSIRFDNVEICSRGLLKRLLFELTPSLEEFSYIQCLCKDINKLELNTPKEYTPPITTQRNLTLLKLYTSLLEEDDESDMDDDDADDNIDNNELRFPINLIELFSTFPNVKKLNLEIDQSTDFLKLFEAIDLVRKANCNEVLNIMELHMVGFTNVDVIRNQSVFSSLPISILNLDVSYTSNDEIISLVQTFKPTLCDLSLINSEDIVEVDYLPNDLLGNGLTKLRITDKFFSSFKFLGFTPKLKDLTLESQDIEEMLRFEATTVKPLVNLKRLVFTKKIDALHNEMEIFTKLVPNVKKCVCTVNSNGFRMVCRAWPNLEHLDVKFDFERKDEDFFVKNLVQLKCLRSLQINCNEVDKVTDKFVFEGLLKLPFLTRIYLPANVAVSDKGHAAMEGKLYDRFDL